MPAKPVSEAAKPSLASTAATGAVLGNRNSHVYHLANGCPGYTQVASKNQVMFGSEGEAQAAGYRKAGNCR
jgi:deoxyribonuclease-1